MNIYANSSAGVYKEDGPYTTYICTNVVKELYSIQVGSPLVMGANVSLNRAIEVFEQMANSYQGYEYLHALVKHWKLVANVSVRNVSIKHFDFLKYYMWRQKRCKIGK